MEYKLGGNSITGLGTRLTEDVVFSSEPYRYFGKYLADGESYKIDNMGSFSVFLKENAANGSIHIDNYPDHNFETGDVIQVENSSLSLQVTGGSAYLLIAGIKAKSSVPTSIVLTKNNRIKKVTKHWGHELWINGEHPHYAFKEIFIKTSTKTSLQYHRLKYETNVLFAGSVFLHYKNNDSIENDLVKNQDISTKKLSSITAIAVCPNTLHRLEALTDTLLYEVSTPHLDDVIRVQDDQHRGDGRIHSEHRQFS